MMCAIFLSHFVFAVFWRTLVAFGFVFHHDWFCRLYMREQKIIASMLNVISQKENDEIALYDNYQKQKQYLLRKMFI